MFSLAVLYASEPDFVVLSSWSFRHFSEPEDDPESRQRFAVYSALFSESATAVLCPVPDRVREPEIWIFALSKRARLLQAETGISGHCRLDWPWLSP